jgi:NAD(P)-dependent dehydrogenase (short-subunit alcohol dehydrogenase family)
VVDAVGHADILVNNAGAIPRGDIFAMTEPKWRESWELKVFGYINATRAMLEKMYARKKGAVVNIIGLAGESYNYDYVTGSMGNASLMAFTRTVGSRSVDHGVRVVAINPPATRTDRMLTLLRGQAEQKWGDPERWPELTKHMPFGRARRGRRPRGVPGLGPGELHQRRGDDPGWRAGGATLERILIGIRALVMLVQKGTSRPADSSRDGMCSGVVRPGRLL